MGSFMLKTSRKTFNWVDTRIETWLCTLFYVYMAGIIVVEVFRRYLLSAASSWGEETAIYSFIWLSYIAAARGVRERKHLSVELIRARLNRKQKFFAYILSDICFFILALVVVAYSIDPLRMNIVYGQTMFGSDLPMALATAVVPVAWSLIAVRVIQRFIVTLKRYKANEPLIKEEEIAFN